MQVTVHFFGPLRRIAGCEHVVVDLDEPSTVGHLLEELAGLSGSYGAGFTAMLPTCAVGIGEEIVHGDHRIDEAEAADVALLPPVAGGCT